MDRTTSHARLVALLVTAAVVVAVLIVLLQVPGLSVRKLLLGERIVAGGQFWLLEFLAGGITSLIITGVVVLMFRRLMVWVSVVSVVMQLAWMAFTLEFARPAESTAEVAFRSAEPLGIVIGAAFAVLLGRGLFQARQRASSETGQSGR